MHLLENYSLSCGLKIGKPFIYEKAFPLTVDKFITLHPASKQAKTYDFWNEVVDILLPILEKEGISIIQIGEKNDAPIRGCHSVSGQTNINQVAYILRHSLLHLGVDSFPTHIASGFGKKIVCLYAATYADVVRPYWSKPEDVILLEADRQGEKPSFQFEEHPKTINRIKPEVAAKSVCQLLNLPFEYKYETFSIGQKYHLPFTIEMVPDFNLDINKIGISSVVVRMDYEFNEDILSKQLSISPCSILTDKPIRKEILQQFKSRIKEIIYFLDETHEPQFVEALKELGIKYLLATTLPPNIHNKFKLYYMDYGIIHYNPIKAEKDIKDLDKTDKKKMFYKSNKITLAQKGVYPSKAAWKANKPIPSIAPVINEIIDTPDFWEEQDCFYLLTKS